MPQKSCDNSLALGLEPAGVPRGEGQVQGEAPRAQHDPEPQRHPGGELGGQRWNSMIIVVIVIVVIVIIVVHIIAVIVIILIIILWEDSEDLVSQMRMISEEVRGGPLV